VLRALLANAVDLSLVEVIPAALLSPKVDGGSEGNRSGEAEHPGDSWTNHNNNNIFIIVQKHLNFRGSFNDAMLESHTCNKNIVDAAKYSNLSDVF